MLKMWKRRVMWSTLIFVAAVLAAPSAYAQPAPVDPNSPEHERQAAEIGHDDPTPSDPTAHFNLWQHLFDYRGKDELGGTFGDGQMKDEATGEIEHEEEPMSPPFVFMLINFGLLLIILAKYGGPAAKKLAQERHDQIKSALDEAAKLRKQAADKLAEYETRIKDVDTEVKKLMEDIRAAAEADKVRILEHARQQAELMKRDAELRIAAEIETARTQLTREVTAAASAATEKLLRDKTNPDDQQKLVATFITGVTTHREAR